MKRNFKRLLVIAFAMFLFCSALIPAFARGFDFDEAIADFESSSNQFINTWDLKVGDKIYLFHIDNSVAYSSDESIATTDGGFVKGISPGTAYIAHVTANETVVYKIIVTSDNAVANDTVVDDDAVTDANTANSYDVYALYESIVAEQSAESGKRPEEIESVRNQIYEQIEKNEAKYEKTEDTINKADESTDVFDGVFIIYFAVIILLAVLIIALTIFEVIYIFKNAPKCGMTRLFALVPLFSRLFGIFVLIMVRTNCKKSESAGIKSAKKITCPTCSGVHPKGTEECSICGTKLQ